MTNGTSNGCHQMQPVQDIPMDFHVSQQPNIHPGCIPSTGRNGRATSMTAPDQQIFQVWGNTLPTNNGAHSTGGGVTNSISGGLSSVSLSGNLVAQATSNLNADAQRLMSGVPNTIDGSPNVLAQVSIIVWLC